MVAEDNFGILWDSPNFWESKCFRNIHECSFESLSPKVLKDISFLFAEALTLQVKVIHLSKS